MARVKRGVTSHAKHKKVLDQAKGYYGRRKKYHPHRQAGGGERRTSTPTRPQNRKRNFRALWIQRINAAARGLGFTYARLIDGLSRAGIEVDKKSSLRSRHSRAGGLSPRWSSRRRASSII